MSRSTDDPPPLGANAIGQYGSTNETFLRGLQTTDVNGSMSFGTMFPGHYSGRTNHLHVMAHLNATVLPNSTVYSNTATRKWKLRLCSSRLAQITLIKKQTAAKYSSTRISTTG